MFYRQEEAPEFIEGKMDYSKHEIELMADEFLRKDSKHELCSKCEGRGEETGKVRPTPQFEKNGEPKLDENEMQLVIDFPEFICENAHRWYKGEGKAKGIGGENPILFEDHLRARKKREIYCKEGSPDPEIVSGIYNRSHKDGRKINTEEQRKKHGAAYYRG